MKSAGGRKSGPSGHIHEHVREPRNVGVKVVSQVLAPTATFVEFVPVREQHGRGEQVVAHGLLLRHALGPLQGCPRNAAYGLRR